MIDQDNHAQPITCTTKHYYQDNMTQSEVLWSPIFWVNIICVILRLTASKMVFR